MEPNPQPIKVVMELIGKCSSAVRAPLVPCEPSTIDILKEQLKRHNLV
jgi:dihydrodipicolinate synthase/N-acetylneuraminate lyase